MKRFSNCGTVSCANCNHCKSSAGTTYNYSCDTEQFGSNGNVCWWYSEGTDFRISVGTSGMFLPQSIQVWVRSHLVSLQFFIDIKSFRSHYGPGVDSASNRNEYQEYFLRGKGGRCVRLTTLPPSCAVVMKSGNLNFLEPSGPLQACNGTALPLLTIQVCQDATLNDASLRILYVAVCWPSCNTVCA